MTLSRRRARSNSKLVRHQTFFGPPPILENEDPAAYRLILKRLYVDLKPRDFIEEGYLNDYAYSMWELQRLRRMRVCCIEAELASSAVWVFSVSPFHHLSYIGKADEAEPKIVKPRVSEEDAREITRMVSEFQEEAPENVAAFKRQEVKTFALQLDTVKTRAFLESRDRLEWIDRMIAIAETHRNASIRELQRYRAGTVARWREKFRDIDAEFTVVKPKNGRKNEAAE